MRVAILGHFGGKKIFNDGQTVKTLSIFNALKQEGIQVDKIDTYYTKHNPIKFIFQLIKSLFRNKKYIVLLAKNGRRRFFSTLAFMSKVFKKEIYHYCIGGVLAQELESGVHKLKHLQSFKTNWVESEIISKKLTDLGLTNASYLPNFKNIDILQENNLKTDFSEPFRFCTFSRILKEKGIEDAIEAIRIVNNKAGRVVANLDIFGPIEKGYDEKFYSVLETSNDAHYCGIIPANDSVSTLKNYYMLLFPTFYPGEGMPGTIIDSLSSGLPIIARRWPYCDDMITHGVNGYVYDFDRPELLVDMILYAISHVEETIEMRKNCLLSAQQYTRDNVIQVIKNVMGI